MKTACFVCWCGCAVLLAASPAALTRGPALETIRVVCIPGAPLPVTIARRDGSFARYGIEVQTEIAPSSNVLRAELASGKVDVAHAAVDNAVAMDETNGAGVVIVMGGERSLNELIGQPHTRSISDLRGRALIVDAPNTAYALQLRKILLSNGLQLNRDYKLKSLGTTPRRLEAMRKHKEYAATMLGPPWSILAKREGFVSLGSVQKIIGPYQSLGAFVRRTWAREHADLLARYLAAYVGAQRWLLVPSNKQQVTELLMKQWRLPVSVANETYALFSEGWYEEDAGFDVDGFNNVLQLRAEIEGEPGGRGPAPQKYYDLSYYEAALAKLKPGQ